jgi:outer membrane protein TolC
MKLNNYLYIFIIIFLYQSNSFAQKVLYLEDYLKIVKNNHPVAQQAALLDRVSDAELLKARGGFEPKIAGELQNKTFDGKNYYTVGDYEFKVPSWYGLEFKGGFNTLTGTNIDPSTALPAAGQAVLGMSASLLQNLIIDERRATLKKARLLREMNKAERQSEINDLLFEASKYYWDWVLYYNQLRIFENSVNLAAIRFEGVRQQFFQGDKAAIDTLESFVLLQDRQFELSEARLEYQNAAVKLSNFLWTENSIPLELSPATVPPNITELTNTISVDATDSLLAVKNQIKLLHPDLLALKFKLEQLEVDRKLKREKLKPELNLNYNLLGNGFNLNGKDNVFLNNYKYGITLNTPILFRKARGDVELANLKIVDTRFKQQQKSLELENKFQAYMNEMETTRQQINTYSEVTRNYSRLLEGENERFRLGESSIFLLNSRERKVIEAELKLNKLKVTLQKTRVSLDYAAGRLGS